MYHSLHRVGDEFVMCLNRSISSSGIRLIADDYGDLIEEDSLRYKDFVPEGIDLCFAGGVSSLCFRCTYLDYGRLRSLIDDINNLEYS